MKKTLASKIKLFKKYKKQIAISLFALSGLILLSSLLAALPAFDFEPEDSSVSGPAQKLNDSNASNNGYLKFGPGTTTEPSGDPVTVRPAKSTAYFGNPGIGWQDDNFTSSQLQMNVEYYRSQFSWKDVNPSKGSYNWKPIDSRIASAKSKGRQASFRVYSMRGEIFGGHQVPQWVLDEGAKITSDGDPDYSNAVYQTRWATFVNALRNKYDGHPDVAFIDISGYGNFNEWSWQNQTTFENNYNNPTTLDGHARNHLADMFIGGSGTVKMRRSNGSTRTMDYSYPGFQKTQLIMPYAGIRQSTWYVWDKNKPIGFRYDCLGQITLNDIMQLGNRMETAWQDAPVVYEFCSSFNESRANTVLHATRGSLVHDNGTNVTSGVKDMLRYAGYRYYPQLIRFDSEASSGGEVNFRLEWKNVGNAKAYSKMGQDYTVRAGLFKSDGTLLNEERRANVSSWLPESVRGSTPYVINASVPTTGAASGSQLKFKIAIVNKNTGKNINLAIDLPKSSRWYEIGTVRIR